MDANLLAEIKTEIQKRLCELGIPSRLKGSQYMQTAISLLIENSDLILDVRENLYAKIAEKHQTSVSRVSSAILRATQTSWDKGDKEVLFGYFRYTIAGGNKPSVNEYLAMVTDCIKLKYYRQIKNGTI